MPKGPPDTDATELHDVDGLDYTDGKMRLDGPETTAKRHMRVAARLTEARSSVPAPLPSERRALASSRQRDAFFASFSRELRCSLDAEDRLALVDGAWQLVLGWNPEDLHGWCWEDLVHQADSEGFSDSASFFSALASAERESVQEILASLRQHLDRTAGQFASKVSS